MWLLPHLSAVSSAAVTLYYRASRDGLRVPREGPVLLVSNHPNALLDPAFLSWVAERPVRFLAKAPLFHHPAVGWLIRASGSIPIYRAQDDSSQMGRNRETFRDVYEALASGSAIGIFPEGTSHTAPGLVPLKTGAARIALGGARHLVHAFPIVPVGLVLRSKDEFRSEAHAVVGAPVEWDDLVTRSTAEPGTARELTGRIERAMRSVTLNLAQWEDEPVIRASERIWVATFGGEKRSSAHVERLARAAGALAQLRARGDPQWDALARDIADHSDELHQLGIEPDDLNVDLGLGRAVRWTARRLGVGGIAQFIVATLAVVLYYVPHRISGWIAPRLTPHRDALSTYRLLLSVLVFGVWIAALTTLGGAAFGWRVGVATAVALPFIAIAGLNAAEHWRFTLATARRWLAVRRRGGTVLAAWRDRQARLAARLEAALTSIDHPA